MREELTPANHLVIPSEVAKLPTGNPYKVRKNINMSETMTSVSDMFR
jgi:hypothetical protein